MGNFEVVGFGESQFIVDNEIVEGCEVNCWIEFVIFEEEQVEEEIEEGLFEVIEDIDEVVEGEIIEEEIENVQN